MADGFFGRMQQFLRPKPLAVNEKLDQFFDSIVDGARSDLAKHVLGSGSESIVFKLGRPAKEQKRAYFFKLGRPAKEQKKAYTSGLVLKAIVDRTLKTLDEDRPPTPQELRDLAAELEEEKTIMEEDFAVLRNAFGDAVPRTRFRVVSVPMTKELIQTHRPEWMKFSQRLPKYIPLLLAVQRRISWKEDYIKIQGNLNTSRDFFLHSSEELQQDFCESYRAITEPVAFQENGVANVAAIQQVYTEIKLAMDQIKSYEENGDDKIRPVFCEAIQSLIRFVNTTKIPIDVIGEKNLVVQKDSIKDTWMMKCPDPLPTERERLGELEDATRALSEGREKPLTQSEKERLAFILNTTLVLNGYAVCLGLEDRVVVPELEKINPERWLSWLKVSKPVS